MTYLQNLNPINRVAHWSTLGSFLVGTLLFLIYFLFKEDTLIGIGIGYLTVAFMWNCLVLLAVIIVAIGQKASFQETVKTIVLMLLNIPIAYGYFLIVIKLQ